MQNATPVPVSQQDLVDGESRRALQRELQPRATTRTEKR
jgi:hypothetical protein